MKQLKDLTKIGKIAKANLKVDKYIVREGGQILKPIKGYIPVVENNDEPKFIPYSFDDEKVEESIDEE